MSSIDARIASLEALQESLIASGATRVTLPTGHSVDSMSLAEVQHQLEVLRAEKAASGGMYRTIALGNGQGGGW